MNNFGNSKEKIGVEGFAIVEGMFCNDEIESLIPIINKIDLSRQTVRKTAELFAIRQFFKEAPQAAKIIFKPALSQLITEIFGRDFFVVKSIYFDKPGSSNWFVSYHQDLTISVDKKTDIEGFGPWTVKQDQYAVQPPLHILEDNFTIRIHLDDTTHENGALRVIPGSHRKGICRHGTIDRANEAEQSCQVKKGGIMFMKPLLLHSSGRTINNNKRRVIHIEFSRVNLPKGLNWSEFLSIRSGPFIN